MEPKYHLDPQGKLKPLLEAIGERVVRAIDIVCERNPQAHRHLLAFEAYESNIAAERIVQLANSYVVRV